MRNKGEWEWEWRYGGVEEEAGEEMRGLGTIQMFEVWGL